MNDMATPFHISIAIADMRNATDFYSGLLGCAIGRSTEDWVDFNLFGHQLTAHVAPTKVTPHDESWQHHQRFPVRHFGAVLDMTAWKELKSRLEDNNITWLIRPNVFFEGQVNEQHCMFIEDPDGHAIEFKAFSDPDSVFTRFDSDE